MKPYSWRELRAVSDEDLITRHDQAVRNTEIGLNYFLEEMARRDAARQMRTMTTLTWWIAGFTLVNVIVTIVGVVIAMTN